MLLWSWKMISASAALCILSTRWPRFRLFYETDGNISVPEHQADGYKRHRPRQVPAHALCQELLHQGFGSEVKISHFCQFCFYLAHRYVQLPGDEVDTQLLQDATRKEAAQNKAWNRGKWTMWGSWTNHVYPLWTSKSVANDLWEYMRGCQRANPWA